MKRRIIYKENKATKQTDILCMQVTEELEDIELKYLDLEYEIDKDKFDRAKKFHIENGKVIFDRLIEVPILEHEKLQDELLSAQAEIVELQFKLVSEGVK